MPELAQPVTQWMKCERYLTFKKHSILRYCVWVRELKAVSKTIEQRIRALRRGRRRGR